MRPPAIVISPSTSNRIDSEAVYQPLAARRPNTLWCAAASSRWNGCGSNSAANALQTSSVKVTEPVANFWPTARSSRYSSRRISVRHRVDDVVDAETVRRRGHRRGVMRVVGVLPRVAHVAVVIQRDHEPAAIVVVAGPVGRACLASPGVPLAWNLRALVEVEQDVVQRVVLGNVDDRPPRQDRFHRLSHRRPFVLVVEVVEDEEPAARKVFAQALELLALRMPVALARLLQEQPRIVEEVLVVERQMSAVRRDLDVRHALESRQEMRLRVRIVDRPPRIAVAARARAAARRIGEPRHVKLGLGRRAAGLGRFTAAAEELRARNAAE